MSLRPAWPPNQQLAEFIEAQVLPSLGPPASPVGRRLLDVGAGDASLAARLLPLFPGGVLAVDCNAALLLGGEQAGGGTDGASSTAGATTVHGRVTKAVADYLQLELPAGAHAFDVVLASHVLYQVQCDGRFGVERRRWQLHARTACCALFA